ncbi:F0F1 ATP synthase subunit A [Lachnospiraceae bacterium OttesenSCG-928-D06]|nr:F0F1 ATP synthase subunit A [Lachnospiraceae bacterium OttesenSCG-928-D06]
MGHGILLSGGSDIDFMIHGVFKYSFFGHEVWITTTHVCVLIVMLIMVAFAIVANRAIKKASEVPSGAQNVAELVVEMLDKVVDGPMGKSAPKFYNYIGTVFIFVLLSNISGLLGLRPPTADYGVTLALGLMTFTLIHFNQFKHQSIKEIWEGMCSPLPPWLPLWMPINLIGEIAVPISLSLRLFANVLSGTVMMALVYGLLGWFATIWPAALHVYFDLFSGAIQTYVFCMLTMTYISNAIGDPKEA